MKLNLRSGWQRALLLWVLSATILALWAGPKRFSWSENDHFAHLARDLHAGRWTHDSNPPGYCDRQRKKAGRCKYHRFDDWAKGHRLILEPLLADTLNLPREFWATPCATTRCRRDKDFGEHRWWVPGRGLTNLNPGAYRVDHSAWFISFPAGPSLWFLVSLWLGLPMIPDILLTWILAATIPASLDLAIRGFFAHQDSPWSFWPSLLALATLFATPMWSIAVQGQVWFLAQISFCALLSAGLALFSSDRSSLRLLGSALWGWALWCRPSAALGVGLALLLLVLGRFGNPRTRATSNVAPRQEFRSKIAVLIAPTLALAAMAYWNFTRLGDPFEFGHRFLQIRWQERIQNTGLFDTSYLSRNLQSFLWISPKFEFPPRVSIHGIGWLWSTPWIFAASMQRRSHNTFLVCGLLILAPTLLYQNTGQLQVSYRFAVDALPFWVMALGATYTQPPRWLIVLMVTSTLIQGWLAWSWVHLGHLFFVHTPRGWPF